MAIVINIVLFVAGAIVFFAVDGDLRGVDAVTVGAILMTVGGIGLLAALVLSTRPTSPRSSGEDREHELIPAAAEEWPESEERLGPRRPPVP